MKIAVTGASGHVGSVLCQRLVDRGFSVRALVHNNEDDLLALGAEIYRGDILDQDAANNLVKGTDVVYHLAAIISIDNKNEELVFKTNFDGTKNIVDACKKNNVKRFIHFSTIHCLKVTDTNAVLSETNPLISDSKLAYEKAKAKAEELIIEECKNGLDAVILNPTAIIGPTIFSPLSWDRLYLRFIKSVAHACAGRL
ncbi:MAG: NAD-dependent epimerase/dehydratase family protein [Bacteroidales bacterium]